MAQRESEQRLRSGDPVERARAVAPLLAAAAGRIEAERELPAEVLAALHEARLFRVALPRGLGGDEIEPTTLAKLTEVIAAADASTAWCLGQAAGCAMSAAFLEPAAARRIFGPPNAVLAWGAGAQGRCVPAAGGYRAGGKWTFASGSRHATWLGGHCKVFEADGSPRLRPDGRQVERTVLFPRAEAAIDDVWHVVGLKGTGTDTYAIEERWFAVEDTLDREDPRELRENRPLYRYPTTLVYAGAFAGVALGVARGMLDALVELALRKTPRGASGSLRESADFQSRLAQLEAQYRASRAYLHATVEAVYAAVAAGEPLTLDRRIDVRTAATWTINQAADVAGLAYRLAGATAVFESGPFERRLRDMYAVSQQTQGRFTHYETIGRHLLGLAPDTMMFL